MIRAVICLAVVTLYGVAPLSAQQEEQRQPTHVYEAYYRVSPSDMEEWNRQYREYSLPVLEELREEGIIQGAAQYQHFTGGDYNIRFVARTHDWAALGRFWDEYLSRLQEVTPEDEWQTGARMIDAHRDEIWDIDEVHMSPDASFSHVYVSTYQVNFADMEEWNRLWSEVASPALEQAMNDGTLAGWVKLNHNTGGPHNSKVLYFFDGWDNIDDLFQQLQQSIQEEHPDAMGRVAELTLAHGDVIWVPTSRSEN